MLNNQAHPFKRLPSDVLSGLFDNEMTMKVCLLNEDAQMPTRGTSESAGYDLYSTEDAVIPNQASVMIHTGVSVEIPQGYVGLLFARSGLASKKHLRPSNCVGVIDSDYRGEVMVNMYNDSYNALGMQIGSFGGSQAITKGERIAQLVILPYIAPRLVEAENLSDTERGEGGFGSTDEKK